MPSFRGLPDRGSRATHKSKTACASVQELAVTEDLQPLPCCISHLSIDFKIIKQLRTFQFFLMNGKHTKKDMLSIK